MSNPLKLRRPVNAIVDYISNMFRRDAPIAPELPFSDIEPELVDDRSTVFAPDPYLEMRRENLENQKKMIMEEMEENNRRLLAISQQRR